ncbi:MAG: winged helix-turn-helix domain-containing protein [Eubacteriales bacterium]|nr:winged helix-turn-helix domain-containing protein [Eubacteriales bacterium]
MATLGVINGAADPEVHERIERYAFSEGILAHDLKSYLKEGIEKEEKLILILADREGLDAISKQMVNILLMTCPVVFLPSSEEEMEQVLRERKYPMEIARYPFDERDFRRARKAYVSREVWEHRTMVFGELRIDRSSREVRLNGQPLELCGYDYDIFLILAEHMGDVVSREFINQMLPERKRSSLRNVDTHIKRIRKRVGREDLIQCIRSVGYCMLEERLGEGERAG